MAYLEIENLSVEFATANGFFRAVDKVNLSVERGDILSIVGESGSGKSVAMMAVMGLLPWTAKVIADKLSLGGTDLKSINNRERRRLVGRDVAMIFQEPMSSLNPCFTIGYQLTEAMRTHLNLDKRAARDRAVELLELVGVPEAAQRLSVYPHQLSGGLNQRVMIAMSVSCNPKLLIADEPTTALDVTIQAQILDLLLDLQKKHNMALILITHDMGVVAETAKKVSVQYAGNQVEIQPVVELFTKPRHPYTAALLSALPEHARGKKLNTIPGVVPGQFDRPRGCAFAPRCAHAVAKCHEIAPTVTTEEFGFARCHRPLDDKGKPVDRELAGAGA